MKKLLACVLLVSLLLMLCSCTGYRAIGLVRIETSHGFETSFLSLDGQLQFKVKKTERGTEGEISYSAVEYSTTVIAKGFTITDEFVAKLKATDEANEAKRIRTLRGQLLADCDYIMLSDVDKTEEEKEAWKAYRQALRDIPEQSGFPWDVVFPKKP